MTSAATTAPARPVMVTGRFAHGLRRVAIYVVLGLIGFLWMIPYVWTVRTSFSSGVNIFSSTLELIPRTLTLDNFVQVARLAPIGRMTVNSLIIVLGATAFIIISSALAGYALSRPGLPFARVIMVFFLAAIMIPGEAMLIPTFLAVRDLGLLNSYPGVILPMATDAFVIFVFERFFAQLPTEVMDAAIVDGASDIQVFLRIVLPMSTPAIAAMTTLVFIGAYDAFLWPLVILSGPEKMPLTLGLYYFASEQVTHYEYIITYSLLLTVPVLLIFLAGQRFFIKGLQLGAVKG
jgi:ABC-type glycerol-3-phosphate transport system permease component